MRTLFRSALLPAGGDSSEPGAFSVVDGRFESFGPAVVMGVGDTVVDLGEKLVLPGVIDGHVHFDDPGFIRREDFLTGTRSAAAGGVTCVADMPCTSLPPVTSPESFREKLAAVAPKALVDYMFWGGISGNLLAEPDWQAKVERLAREGVAAFKLYYLSGMETFTDLTSARIEEALGVLESLGVPAGVHAEDRELVLDLTRRRKASGSSPLDYAASRPPEAERRAVADLVRLCRKTGARVHVVHLASASALEEVRRARTEGLPVSAETCPHYLAFTRRDLERQGSLLKTAPVVKGELDLESLWAALADGTIQHVATDHAAAEWPGEKTTGSIWTDYGGVPGTELLLPFLFSEGVAKGRISLSRMTDLLSASPASFFGAGGRKGRLAAGLDADFVVFDPAEPWTVDPAALHNKNRYSPFAGWRFSGRVVSTWVRGERVYARSAEGETFGDPGYGVLVRRTGRA